MASDLMWAAACRAVLPTSLTALTSAPKASAVRTASSVPRFGHEILGFVTAQTGGDHQQGRPVVGGRGRVGTAVGQALHDLGVAGHRGQHERGGAAEDVHALLVVLVGDLAVPEAGRRSPHPGVRIGSEREQCIDERELAGRRQPADGLPLGVALRRDPVRAGELGLPGAHRPVERGVVRPRGGGIRGRRRRFRCGARPPPGRDRPRVRVGPRLEQKPRHAHLPAHRGDDQRARAVGHGGVDIRPRRHEAPSARQIPLPGREQKRREAEPRTSLDVGSVGEEHRQDVRMATGRGEHQRGLSAHRIGSVDLRPRGEERAHRGDAAGGGRPA